MTLRLLGRDCHRCNSAVEAELSGLGGCGRLPPGGGVLPLVVLGTSPRQGRRRQVAAVPAADPCRAGLGAAGPHLRDRCRRFGPGAGPRRGLRRRPLGPGMRPCRRRRAELPARARVPGAGAGAARRAGTRAGAWAAGAAAGAGHHPRGEPAASSSSGRSRRSHAQASSTSPPRRPRRSRSARQRATCACSSTRAARWRPWFAGCWGAGTRSRWRLPAPSRGRISPAWWKPSSRSGCPSAHPSGAARWCCRG